MCVPDIIKELVENNEVLKREVFKIMDEIEEEALSKIIITRYLLICW